MAIERVFVAGAGTMGHGIAQVVAAAGLEALLFEPELARADAGRERIAANLERSVAKGRLGRGDAEVTLARVRATDRAADVADADLVIEAVVEDAGAKERLWRELDALAPPTTLFATNTSSIPIDRLAASVGPARRARFLGMHFFNPAPAMPLVELVRASATSDETASAVRELAARLGKTVVESADRPGFVVNRILFPLLVEAMRTLEEGVGTAEAIDAGAKAGLNHPMGPLELADLIGLDTCLEVLDVLADGLGERFAPPRILRDLVSAGHLGRKTGRGFHDYARSERTAR